MVKKILTGAGLIEDETFTESHFRQPPKHSSYACYLDNVSRRGADNLNLVTEHNMTIELYEYFKDPELENEIEIMFDELGIEYDKEPRLWLEDEQLYQVLYHFKYFEKGEKTNG